MSRAKERKKKKKDHSAAAKEGDSGHMHTAMLASVVSLANNNHPESLFYGPRN